MNRTHTAGRLMILFWSLACFCTGLFVHAPAAAITKKEILIPLQHTLRNYEKSIDELNRQIKKQFSYYDNKQKELEKALLALESEAQSALEENEALRQTDSIAVIAGWQLITELDDILYLPGYERITMNELLDLRDKHGKELDAEASEIASGTRDFMVPGCGMVNKQTLEKRLNDLSDERNALGKKVEEGTVRLYSSELGFVSKKELETAIATQKDKIDTVAQQIADGDYVVFIPGLGTISRKQLKKKIVKLKERIKQIKKSYAAGNARINRSPKGWFTANDLVDSSKLLQKKSVALHKQLKQNEFEHLLPIGWMTLKDLDERIKQINKEKKATQKLVSEKKYKIALPDGSWATERDIDKAMVNSLLSNDVKASLKQGKKSIYTLSNYEIAKMDLEIAKLQKWKKEFKNHVEPLLENNAQQQKNLQNLKKEFSIEQHFVLAPLQQQLSLFQQNLRQLP